MKVLLVAPGILPVPPTGGGGTEWCIYHLAEALQANGIEVVLVADTGEEYALSGIKVYPVNAAPLSDVRGGLIHQAAFACYDEWLTFRAAARAFKLEKPDVVHVHEARGSLAGSLLSISQIPLVLTVHNPLPWTVRYRTQLEQLFRVVTYRSLDLRLLRRADRVITVQQPLKDELIRLGVAPGRVVTIHNGVDVRHFQYGGTLALHNLPRRYILTVGRLWSRKGLDFLIRSMPHIPDDTALVVVGTGPEETRLAKLADKLGLTSRVLFLGAVRYHNLPPLYRKAELFVLPSLAETRPLVIMEALAAGLPCVASDLPGIRTLIRDRRNGYLVPPGDVANLSRCLATLLREPGLIANLRVALQSATPNQYSWKRVAEQHIRLYETVAAKSKGKVATAYEYLSAES